MQSYGELCTQFYDLDKPTAPELALEWFAAQLAEVNGRILEPMCGSGRFLVPMLQRGLLVDGVDPSGPMLSACRARLTGSELPKIELWQQTLETMELPGRYAAAFIPASSFCLLHEPEVAARALERLHAHLEPGAPVLIEFEPPYDTPPSESTKTLNDGARQLRLTINSVYDQTTQIETMTNRYELKQSGRVVQTEDEVLHLRCYKPEQMNALLAQTGFKQASAAHHGFGWVARAIA